MPSLLKHRNLAVDRWQPLRGATTLADLPGECPVLVPLALWRTHAEALQDRGDVGVWLAPDDDPAELAGAVDALPVIAIDFPQFTDGRGYSLARLLRERYGFANELRAVGDVRRDQLFALSEVGFDAFVLRDGEDAEAALASFDDFRGVYAPTATRPLPWFRRRGNAGAPVPG